MIEINAVTALLIAAAALLRALTHFAVSVLPLISQRANERAVRLIKAKRKQR